MRHLTHLQGSGSIQCVKANDTVTMGGLTIPEQTFGGAYRLSTTFNDFPNDGLIGMAFGSIAKSRSRTFFENLILEGQVKRRMFSVHLTRKQESGSEVVFSLLSPQRLLFSHVHTAMSGLFRRDQSVEHADMDSSGIHGLLFSLMIRISLTTADLLDGGHGLLHRQQPTSDLCFSQHPCR